MRVTRRFPASAEQVLDAWLDPAVAGKWLFATPGGEMLRVEMDARVGGRFAVVERRGAVEAYHGGEYLVLVRPALLCFTFAVNPELTDAARVRVEIRAGGGRVRADVDPDDGSALCGVCGALAAGLDETAGQSGATRGVGRGYERGRRHEQRHGDRERGAGEADGRASELTADAGSAGGAGGLRRGTWLEGFVRDRRSHDRNMQMSSDEVQDSPTADREMVVLRGR